VTEADRAKQLRAVNRELAEAVGRPWFPPVVEPVREPRYVSEEHRERRRAACCRFREARRRARGAADASPLTVPAPESVPAARHDGTP
jgi:hypothetical protein